MIEKKEQPVIQVISVEDKPVPKKDDNTPKPIPRPTPHKEMIELPAEECEESEEECEETSESEQSSVTSIINGCEEVANILNQLMKTQQKDMD